MLKTTIYTCEICGKSAKGPNAEKKIKFCESLPAPDFKFKVGEIVQHLAFHWRVIGCKYRRRGNKHVCVYRMKIVKCLQPSIYKAGREPIGREKTADENLLHSISD